MKNCSLTGLQRYTRLFAILSFFFLCNVQKGTTQILDTAWTRNHIGQDSILAGASDIDPFGTLTLTGYVQTTSNGQDLTVVKYNTLGDTIFTDYYDGSAHNHDRGVGVTRDTSGNIYVVGNVRESSGPSIFTRKYSPTGSILWTQIYSAAGTHTAIGIQWSLNGIFVVGNSRISGQTDLLVIEYDPATGSQQYAYNYGVGGSDEVANAMVVDTLDQVYITGYKRTGSAYDLLITKILAGGTQDWQRTYNGPASGTDIGNMIMLDLDTNIYITGLVTNTGSIDYITLKYSNSGVQKWTEFYDGNGGTDIAKRILVDENSDVYITGTSKLVGGDSVITTVSYDSNGVFRWQNTFYGTGFSNYVSDLIVLQKEVCVLGSSGISASNNDYVTISYDRNTGAQNWKLYYNGSYNGNDEAHSLGVDSLGNIYAVGQTAITSPNYQITTVKYVPQAILMPPDPNNEPASLAYSYIDNRGQVNRSDGKIASEIYYYTTGTAPSMYLTDTSISFVQYMIDTAVGANDSTFRIDMKWNADNSQAVTPYPIKVNEGYTNYYFEHIPEGRTTVNNYQRIVYNEIYPGIDMHLYSNTYGRKFYFIIHPYADPETLYLNFEGQDSIKVGTNGELILYSPYYDPILEEAIAYQYDPSNNSISSLGWIPGYDLVGSAVNFTTGSYDTSKPLVIMIKKQGGSCSVNYTSGWLEWSTYFGGTDNVTNFNTGDSQRDVALDVDNLPHFCGHTLRNQFPVTNGAQMSNEGGYDMTVARFSSIHSRIWTTYYGGSDDEFAWGIDVINDFSPDVKSDPVICGVTSSADLIMVNPIDGTHACNTTGCTDAVVARYNQIGILTFSTYYGDNDDEYAYDIAVNTFTNKLIIGGSASASTVVQDDGGYHHFNNQPSNANALLFQIDYSNNTLDIGGRMGLGEEAIWGVETDDSNGDWYITGRSNIGFEFVSGSGAASLNTDPSFSSTQSVHVGDLDGFIIKFNSSDDAEYCMYFGGSDEDLGDKLVYDGDNSLYIVGHTNSSGILTYQPGTGYIQSNANSTYDAYVMKVSHSSGSCSIEWATCFGGDGEEIYSIAAGVGGTSLMDIEYDTETGNIYVAGPTSGSATVSSNYIPVPSSQPYGAFLSPGLQELSTGLEEDGFVVAFDSDQNLIYSTNYGGSSTDRITGIEITTTGRLYISGETQSINNDLIPVTYCFPVKDYNSSATTDFYDGDGTNNFIGFISMMNVSNINIPTSIPEMAGNGKISVYPVPTQDYITVDMTHIDKATYINIYDITGKLVKSMNPSGLIESMDISELRPGYYNLLVICSSGAYGHPVIVSR